MPMRVPRAPREGDLIRENWTRGLTRVVKENQNRLFAVEQFNSGQSNQNHRPDLSGLAGGLPANQVWNETGRTPQASVNTDSGGNTHTDNVAVQIVLELASDPSKTMTINLAPPPP